MQLLSCAFIWEPRALLLCVTAECRYKKTIVMSPMGKVSVSMRKFDAATAPTNNSKTFPYMHAQLSRHSLEWYAGSAACLRGGTASSSTQGAPLADI
jgi:hypothetical protein